MSDTDIRRPVDWWLDRLEHADVLLSRSAGWLGAQIATFTGGTYTHTLLWDDVGADNHAPKRALNATKSPPRFWEQHGVAYKDLQELVDHKLIVDVYRYTDSDLEDEQRENIVAAGRRYLGTRFHFSALVHCAFRARWNKHLYRYARPLFELTRRYIDWAAEQGAANGMMCAEFVSTSYHDAGVPIRVLLQDNGAGQFYGLDALEEPEEPDDQIEGVLGGIAGVVVDDNEVQELLVSFERLLGARRVIDLDREVSDIDAGALALFTPDPGGAGPSTQYVGVAGDDLPFGILSPRHFEQSPSFERLGRITKR